MNEGNAEIGSRILELRRKSGLSREKLAEKADISVQFLADIEKGRKSMTVNTLRKLSAALLVTTDHIVNGRSEENDELISLCRSLTADKQKKALKLLRVFIEISEE